MSKSKTSKIWNSKWPAVILMLVGACFMGYGISRGELAVVFTKAINICMECVGIGCFNRIRHALAEVANIRRTETLS